MALTGDQTDKTSMVIRDGTEVIAQIRDLRLQNVRFRPGGRLLIGEEVPCRCFGSNTRTIKILKEMPGSNGTLQIQEATEDCLKIVCKGNDTVRLSGKRLSRRVCAYR